LKRKGKEEKGEESEQRRRMTKETRKGKDEGKGEEAERET
jgi:hypothetical protein